MNGHDKIMRHYEHLQTVLRAEMAQRFRRQKMVRDEQEGHDRACEWVIIERKAMLEEVNLLRAIESREPVTIDDVFRCETQAGGHCDYFNKFALYCAELVEK